MFIEIFSFHFMWYINISTSAYETMFHLNLWCDPISVINNNHTKLCPFQALNHVIRLLCKVFRGIADMICQQLSPSFQETTRLHKELSPNSLL